MPHEIAAIVAMGQNRVIGWSKSTGNNGLPWANAYPEDLLHFSEMTTNGVVAMGYDTWMAMGERLLPKRTNVIIARGELFVDDALVFQSVEDVIEWYNEKDYGEEDNTLWFIGGARVYQKALPYCTRVEVTLIPEMPSGDILMPTFEDLDWRAVNPHLGKTVTFVTYTK
jgi:dihydrofolate reductase